MRRMSTIRRETGRGKRNQQSRILQHEFLRALRFFAVKIKFGLTRRREEREEESRVTFLANGGCAPSIA
jgi:hypothetical protein